MSPSPDRARLTIERPGEPELYQAAPMPDCWEVIGTVTRGKGDTGALVRFRRTGTYCQANGGIIDSLPQDKIIAALGQNAKKFATGRRTNVYLDEETIARARKLGNGNMSEGIRKALKAVVPESALDEMLAED